MFNYGKTFYLGNEIFTISSEGEFVLRIKELFDLNPSSNSIFLKKIYAGSKGADIYKFRVDEIKKNRLFIQKVYRSVIKSEFVFQETIIQHTVMNMLNPYSVNTIRMDTFLDKEGKVNVLSGLLRMSLKKHYVDNISSGGCRVGIDLVSGALKKYGYPDFINAGNKVFTCHPETGIVFEDFKLPFIEEAKDLISRAASLMPGLRIIGWDVAITETGPIIIEGNSDYDIRLNDLAYGGYLAHPVLRNVLVETKL